MSLFFSFLFILLVSQKSFSRELFLISYPEKQLKQAKAIKKMLHETYSIPKRGIHLRKRRPPCKKNNHSLLHICIDKNNQYKVVKQNSKVLKRSFFKFRLKPTSFSEE